MPTVYIWGESLESHLSHPKVREDPLTIAYLSLAKGEMCPAHPTIQGKFTLHPGTAPVRNISILLLATAMQTPWGYPRVVFY